MLWLKNKLIKKGADFQIGSFFMLIFLYKKSIIIMYKTLGGLRFGFQTVLG